MAKILISDLENVDLSTGLETIVVKTDSAGIKKSCRMSLDSVATAVAQSGTSTIDTAMSDTSTNAVQNKTIKEYVDKNAPIAELSSSSTRPIQSATVYDFAKNPLNVKIDTTSVSLANKNPAGGVFNYASIPSATQSKAGVMSAADKLRLDTMIDDSMSDSSTNAVQNKVVKAYIDNNEPIEYVVGGQVRPPQSGAVYDALSIAPSVKQNADNITIGNTLPDGKLGKVATITSATETVAGVMSASDKTNVDLIPTINENVESNTEKIEEHEILIKAMQREIQALERYGTDLVGYVRVSGKEDPVFTQSYNIQQADNVTTENVMDIFKPCLVDKDGHITKVLNPTTLQDEDGNDAVIDGSQGNLLICNVRGYYHITGKVTVDGIEYDVFLRKLTAFAFGGRQAEYQPPFGMSPNYCVAHKDSDNITRMYSAYNPSWVGSWSASSYTGYAKGRYNFSGQGDDITATYDADDYMVRQAGTPSTNLALYTGEQYAQNHNEDTSKPYPYCNMTARGVELFVGNLVAEMGTWAAHKPELMGSGFSSNVTPTTSSFTDPTDKNACNGFMVDGICKSISTPLKKSKSSVYVLNSINDWRTPWECLEQQRVLAYCAKNNIAPNTFFTWNGNKYRYRNIDGLKGLAEGAMNAVVYKYMSSQLADDITWTDGTEIVDKRIDFIVSSAVYRGRITDVSPSWWISGLLNVINGDDNNSQTWYIQRNQHKLITCKNWADITSDSSFDFESTYTEVDTYPQKKGYSIDFMDEAIMLPKTWGASLYTGIGHYVRMSSTASTGKKSLRGFRLGYPASIDYLSLLFTNSNGSPSNSDSHICFGICCMIEDNQTITQDLTAVSIL